VTFNKSNFLNKGWYEHDNQLSQYFAQPFFEGRQQILIYLHYYKPKQDYNKSK